MTDRRTIGLVGLGLVSGSLAASLRAKESGWWVRATDRRQSSLSYALQKGLIDEASESLEKAVEGADVIVLATPLEAVRGILAVLGDVVRPGQTVTDVAGTKASILQAAREALPEGVVFVGGHPVVGVEHAGVESALAGLFEGKPCVLTPEHDTPRQALEQVTTLWREVGAEVRFMDAVQHDRVFALVSQLPRVVAQGILKILAAEVGEADLVLAGGSFRELSRVALGGADPWPVVCRENRGALLEALDKLVGRLREVRGAVDVGDVVALETFFDEAVHSRGEPWAR